MRIARSRIALGDFDRIQRSRSTVMLSHHIHKLTAGAGYDYLTRQVGTLDATKKGHTGLASISALLR
jgi:hypothetical protein